MKTAIRAFGWLAIVFGASFALLLTFYNLSGQYVDENGWLVEEFWALALGTLALALSTLSGTIALVLLWVYLTKAKRRRSS